MRCLPLFVSAIFGCSLLGACSSSTVPATEDDDDEFSSSSKAKNSSSSVKGEGSGSESGDIDNECVGETGNPWNGTTAKEFACGSGTKLSPYMILTAEQLAHLSFIVGAKDKEYNGKYFKLGADIILNEGDIIDENGALVADSTKLHKWTPIGNSNVAFTGNFDGDGHSVSGVFINTTSTHNGLFGNSSGTIQNVTVENGWVKGGKYTAGIVGYSVGTVSDIQNAISVVGTDECTGGVIGNSARREYKYNSVIKNIINRGAVEGGKNVGGVAGCATYVTVNGVENIAKVDGYAYVGGTLGGIGISKENDIQNLRNSGAISGSHFVGGVAGHCGGILSVYSSGKSSISGCSNTSSYSCGTFANAMNEGNVDGVHFVGGVLGEVCGGSLKSVANTALVSGDSTIGGVAGYAGHVTSGSMYNTSDVSGKLRVGGIFGQNTEGVTNAAYSTGKVDGDTLVGLMIGYNYNTTMADYYYLEQGDQEPFGLNNGGGVATPKTAEEMKSQEFAELLGENFAYDPEMNDGYPVLERE